MLEQVYGNCHPTVLMDIVLSILYEVVSVCQFHSLEDVAFPSTFV
jgi:hypothetical protein